MRLWGIIRKNHKMRANQTVPLASGQIPDVMEALDDLLKIFDLSRPLVLEKHKQELAQYGKTAFLPRDFIDSVPFDRFEIEILFDEDMRARRSNDPRNDFR